MNQNIDVLNLAKYINMEEIPKSWNIAIKQIKDRIPERIDWLDIKESKKILGFYGINGSEYIEKYIEAVNMINKDLELKKLVYLWHYILYMDNTNLSHDIWNWNTTKNLYIDHGNFMLPVVALLSGYKMHIKIMSERKYSKKQIEIQKENIKKICTNDNKRYNLNGIRFSQMVWGSYFMRGYIIQIGRLQYDFRNTNIEKIGKYIKINENVNYVYIHIPEGEHLLEKDVEESLQNSKYYIPKYFPKVDMNNVVFFTQTWLLSNELDSILKEDSNILKFKKKFKIVNQEEGKNDFLNFVFNTNMEKNTNYEDLKEDTYLQRRLKQYLINGKTLHIGLGILKEF